MFRPDKPIEVTKDDILGRSVFSHAFGQAILTYSEKESIVTAIYGGWGSGRSSVINMTLEYIKKESKNKKADEKPIVVKFNPWNYSNQSHLIALFFKELSFVLQREGYGEEAKNVGEKLEVYANFFTPLALAPEPAASGVTLTTQKTRKTYRGAGKAAKAWRAAHSKYFNATRSELNKLLGRQKRKLIIVIDDIDKLNNDEIRQIFQLVKTVGDFTNTIYVLSFDRNVVVKALTKTQEGSGDDYLEKVVQFPVELPPIGKSELEKLLFSLLDDLIKGMPEGKWDSAYWWDIYHGGIKNHLKTIRDVIRFINTLKFSFAMVRDNVNPVDFIAITALQVFEPDLYSGIKNNKDLFTGVIKDGYQPNGAEKKQAASRLDEIIGRAKSFKEEESMEFLNLLFPNLGGGAGSDWLSAWRSKARICHPDIFGTYFLLAVPPGEVPNSEITSVLDLASDKAAFKAALIRLNEDGKIVKYLSLMEDFTKDYILPENIQNITAALMDVGDTFPESAEGIFDFSTNMRILRIFKQLSLRIDKQKDRFENINKAINETTESIHTIVGKVGDLRIEHHKNPASMTQAQLKPDDEREVSEQQLTRLESRAVEKISEWAKEGKLDKHPNLISILTCWCECDSNGFDAAKNHVKNMLANDDGLINFTIAFASFSFSQFESGYTSLKSVANFVDIEDVEHRIRQLKSSVNYADLPKNQKDALEIFLDAYDDKVENDKN